MFKKIAIITSVLICFIITGYFLLGNENKKTEYIFGNVTRGDLYVIITSSGTIEATSTVDVGTQVSGKIDKLYVDFNSEVKKGQLLAVLDTITLAAQVRDAQANLAKSKAEYNQKKAIHLKNKQLYEKNFISELDFIQSETELESAFASLKSSESALERARTNLGYAYIYAPIAGKIINRSVEAGQTVAASLQTPTLFTIAEDLSSMRILANVDESDIGQIKEGQKVNFTVQTYSDKKFEGTVTQIRLQANTVSNVVNYIVVVHADNSENLLLPGMTATVDFYVDSREGVLLVPNTALRYEPDEETQKRFMTEMKKNRLPIFEGNSGNMPAPPEGFPFPGTSGGDAKISMAKVFVIDSLGNLKMFPFISGLTDGKNTEIIMSRDLKKGMKVITGTLGAGTTETKKSNSLSPQGGFGGPPPMM